MTYIDIRTFFTGYVLIILICAIVMASLWWQNRKRSPEIALWFADYVLQFAGLLLITFRGILPDFITIVLANLFIIGGTIILYTGLGRYVGTESRQWHNYVMLTVFTLVHAHFTYIYPDIALRTVNISFALFYVCAQVSWLMLRRVRSDLRPATRATGIVFVLFCLVSIVQIAVNLTIPKTHNIFVSGFFNLVAILMYQILFVALTFALFLMVSRRLSTTLESELIQRMQAEEQIRLNETRLISLLNIMQHRSKTVQEFLDYALDEAIKITQSKIGYIYFYHEDSRQFILNTWSKDVMHECTVANPQTCYELDKTGVWGEAVRQRKPIILNDFQAAHPLKKGYPEGHAHLNKFMTVPVFKDDAIVAVVGVANKSPIYDEADVLQLTLLMDAVWKSVDIKMGEKKLRESDERYKALFDRSLDFVYTFDFEGRFIDANTAALNGLGYTREDIHSLNFASFLSEDQLPLALKTLQEIQETGIQKDPVEFRIRHKNGSEVYVESKGSTIMSNGIPVAIQAIARDITERKRAEEALKKSSQLLRDTGEMAKVGGWELDVVTKEQVWTEEVYRIHEVDMNYTPTVSKGIDFYAPASRPIIERAVQRAIEHSEPFDVELEIITAKGNLRAVRAVGKIDQEHGKVLGTFQDITERKKQEELILLLNEQQQIILDASPSMIFYKDKENRFIRVNEALARTNGMSKKEMEGKTLWEIYPKEAADSYWQDDKEVMTSGKPVLNIIEEMKTPQGTMWVQSDKIPYRNSKGEIIGIIGFTTDITERKRAEEKLRKQAEDMRVQNEEMTRFNRVAVGREMQMIELKREINELCRKLGEPPRHRIPEAPDEDKK